jgi:hypothetical protein
MKLGSGAIGEDLVGSQGETVADENLEAHSCQPLTSPTRGVPHPAHNSQ